MTDKAQVLAALADLDSLYEDYTEMEKVLRALVDAWDHPVAQTIGDRYDSVAPLMRRARAVLAVLETRT